MAKQEYFHDVKKFTENGRQVGTTRASYSGSPWFKSWLSALHASCTLTPEISFGTHFC
jgi:hypothetical protein